jgi:hypothetical protein
MTRKLLVTAVVALVALGLSSTAYAATNIVANPSFEESLGGTWTQTGAGVDVISAPSYQVQDGQNAIDLNSNDLGGIKQTLITSIGTYELTYWMAANPACGTPDLKTMDVFFDGSRVAQSTFDPTQPGLTQENMLWAFHRVTVFATSSATELAFVSTGPAGACGPTLDNVSVTAGTSTAVVHSISAECAGDVVHADAFAQGAIGTGFTITLHQSSGGSPYTSTGQTASFEVASLGTNRYQHDFDLSALTADSYKVVSSDGVESHVVEASSCGPGSEIPEASAALLLPLSVLGTFGIAAGVLYVRRRNAAGV